VSARQPRDAACLFCRLIAGEIPSTAVAQGERVLAIRDIAPAAPTHVLILSREHIPSAADLGAEDAALLGEAFALAGQLAGSEGIADAGYRIVTNVGAWGGQSVDHLHFHVMGGRQFSWPPG
jgi:histidine triad (HIT) family protein